MESRDILPFSECFVNEILNREFENKNVILEGNDDFKNSGIMIARGFVRSDDRPQALVVNLSDKIVRINKNTKLGNAIIGELPEHCSREFKVANIATKSSDVNKKNNDPVEQIDFSHLEFNDKNKVKKLLRKYNDIFGKGIGNLSSTHKIKHRIVTDDVPPITKRPYRVPYHQREMLQEKIDEMLEKGITMSITIMMSWRAHGVHLL
ncbi:uncharacterized protein [Onthophagus taurus]|uniref:uncharacterized protein n=1 Tax=Onthophagus taurus TaxID=166361 RepID=UPI0039BE2443